MAKQYIKPRQLMHELAQRVIAVAVPRHGCPDDWAAYIDAVPGVNHDCEERAVIDYGNKLRKKIACMLFPQFKPGCYCE